MSQNLEQIGFFDTKQHHQFMSTFSNVNERELNSKQEFFNSSDVKTHIQKYLNYQPIEIMQNENSRSSEHYHVLKSTYNAVNERELNIKEEFSDSRDVKTNVQNYLNYQPIETMKTENTISSEQHHVFKSTYNAVNEGELSIKQEILDSRDVKTEIQKYSNYQPIETLQTQNTSSLKQERYSREQNGQKTVKVEDSWHRVGFDEEGRGKNAIEFVKCGINVDEEQSESENVATDLKEGQNTFYHGEQDAKPTEDTNDSGENVLWCNCEFCDFKTKHKHALIRHFKLNHNEWYYCQFCEYKTQNKTLLTLHSKAKHGSEYDFVYCDMCSFKTIRKINMIRHFRYKHNMGVKWHQCQLCKYKTKFKPDYDKHLDLHNNKEPEVLCCKFCNYQTVHLPSYKRHYRSLHNDQVVWHQCEFCDFKTKYKTSLPKHHLKHNKNAAKWYVCPVELCNYKTVYKYSLRRHVESKHDKIFNWQCEFCDFKTAWKENLKTHVERHRQKQNSMRSDISNEKTNHSNTCNTFSTTFFKNSNFNLPKNAHVSVNHIASSVTVTGLSNNFVANETYFPCRSETRI